MIPMCHSVTHLFINSSPRTDRMRVRRTSASLAFRMTYCIRGEIMSTKLEALEMTMLRADRKPFWRKGEG